MQAEINPANYTMESENLTKSYESKNTFETGDAYINSKVTAPGLLYLPEQVTFSGTFVLSRLYWNHPGMTCRITGMTCSIPTNILTLQPTFKKSLGFKYSFSSSPAVTYRHKTGWW